MTTTTATAYLTRIQLSPRSRDAARDLGDAQNLHRRVLSLIPDQLGDATRTAAGVLFRLERTPGAHTLLIQSTAPLNLDALPVGYATATDDRNLARLLDWIAPGNHVRYRIDAVPMRSIPNHETDTNGRRKRGKRIPIHGADATAWWHRHAEIACLATTPDQILTTPQPDLTGWKTTDDDRRIRVGGRITRFEGNATITNPEALRIATLQGIGRNRAYGAGLLSIAPLATQ